MNISRKNIHKLIKEIKLLHIMKIRKIILLILMIKIQTSKLLKNKIYSREFLNTRQALTGLIKMNNNINKKEHSNYHT